MLFDDNKRYYIDRRLIERIAATESDSFQAYFAMLRADADHEIEHLINAFTVNETYFYREEHQLRCMTSDLLGNITREKTPGRIDPHLVDSLLDRRGALFDRDVADGELEPRRQLQYRDRRLRYRYPGAQGRGEWHLRRTRPHAAFAGCDQPLFPAGRRTMNFRSIPACEILSSSPGLTSIDAQDMARYRDFDIVFCRNVLIYFDDASRRIAAENLYDCLGPGGYICLGHSETMSRISPLFHVCRFPRCDRLSKAVRRSMTEIEPASTGSQRRDSGRRRFLAWCGSITATRSRKPGSRSSRPSTASKRMEKVLAKPFDLVIVDVNMPRMDGFSFLRTLRRSAPDVATLPALVITTEAGEQDVEPREPQARISIWSNRCRETDLVRSRRRPLGSAGMNALHEQFVAEARELIHQATEI